jgi:FAD:protein FMN transferase
MKPGQPPSTPGFNHIPGLEAGSVHRFAHGAMATVFEIFCTHPDAAYARQAASAVFDLVDQLEGELSCHRENSDIARINHLRDGQELLVSPWTMDCLVQARCFHVETRGVFDISLGSGLPFLELFPMDFVVRAGADGIRLDLGGIGKGYAIDRAGEVLEEWGVHQALLHAGFSSVLALEPPVGQDGWSLTMSRPGAEQDAVFARIQASRQALSSSGIRKGDHILDPRTGRPVRNRPGAWISAPLEALSAVCRGLMIELGVPDSVSEKIGVSPSAAAEAFSTAFMILPMEEIQACCRRHAGLQAWVLEHSSDDSEAGPALSHFGA